MLALKATRPIKLNKSHLKLPTLRRALDIRLKITVKIRTLRVKAMQHSSQPMPARDNKQIAIGDRIQTR